MQDNLSLWVFSAGHPHPDFSLSDRTGILKSDDKKWRWTESEK